MVISKKLSFSKILEGVQHFPGGGGGGGGHFYYVGVQLFIPIELVMFQRVQTPCPPLDPCMKQTIKEYIDKQCETTCIVSATATATFTLVAVAAIPHVTHVCNNNSNIQGRSLNVMKVILHTIRNCSLKRSSHFEKGRN